MFTGMRTIIASLFAAVVTVSLMAAPAQAAPKGATLSYAQILLTGTDIEVVRTVSASIDAWMVSNGKAPSKWEMVPSGSMHNDACTEGLPACLAFGGGDVVLFLQRHGVRGSRHDSRVPCRQPCWPSEPCCYHVARGRARRCLEGR